MQYSIFEEDTIYEYFILLSPNWGVKSKVREMKSALDAMIGLNPENMKSFAHISLYKQKATEAMQVSKKIKKLLNGQKKFTVSLQGHDVFKQGDKRTLYLKIENPEPIENLLALLNPPKKAAPVNRQTSILDKPKRVTKKITPHLTIARNIAKADFERIADFTPFDYHAKWECDKVSILRRVWGTNDTYDSVGEINLL
ncbi:MAG: 2'-5' RNA ligase family protein [Flavobacterium sp.]|nr:MAG: 2'-5' RNA ligase family protein [Flavobacterium sp.]